MSEKPRLLVFATGEKDCGGSGLRELIENSLSGMSPYEIVGVVSNHEEGGVAHIVQEEHPTHFEFMPSPFSADHYQEMLSCFKPDFVALSGWMRLVKGLDPARTFNIHPGPLPPLANFGGEGMHGDHVHEAVMKAFAAGELTYSAVTMHFITEPKSKKDYDKGPPFFQYKVWIRKNDTPKTLQARVNKIEHAWQSWVTGLVVTKKIRWNGVEGHSVRVPPWYQKMPFCPETCTAFTNS